MTASPEATAVHEASGRRSELAAGWKPLSAAFAAYGFGPVIFLQTNSLFVAPIRDATGLSASQVQTGSVVNLFVAIAGVGVGAVLNRFGSRRLVLTGFSLLGMLAVLLAVLPASPVAFYGIAALLGVTGALCYQIPFTTLVTTWFTRNFGLAQGFMSAGASVAPLLATPLIVAVIYSAGWRAGYLVMAGLILLVALPVAFAGFREKPGAATARARSGVPVLAVLRSARLWTMFLGCTVATFAIGGFLSSLQPALLEGGRPVALASAMSMIYLGGIVAGRVIGGFLLDRMWPYLVPLIVCVISGLTALVFASTLDGISPVFLGVLVFLLGHAQGADADFPAYFTLQLAGRRAFSAALGVVAMATGLATTAGGFAFAAIRDLTGSYVDALRLGGVAYLVSGGILLGVGVAGRVRRGRQEQLTESSDEEK